MTVIYCNMTNKLDYDRHNDREYDRDSDTGTIKYEAPDELLIGEAEQGVVTVHEVWMEDDLRQNKV